MKNDKPSIEALRMVLRYDEQAGIFWWKRPGKGRRDINSRPAGSANQRGQVTIFVPGGRVLAHRLAWAFSHGVWPSGVVDHIDGNPRNNAITNLRDVSQVVNMQNRRAPALHNKTRRLGVYPEDSKFVAQISVNGRKRRLGRFDSPDVAHEAYLQAKRQLHPGNTL